MCSLISTRHRSHPPRRPAPLLPAHPPTRTDVHACPRTHTLARTRVCTRAEAPARMLHVPLRRKRCGSAPREQTHGTRLLIPRKACTGSMHACSFLARHVPGACTAAARLRVERAVPRCTRGLAWTAGGRAGHGRHESGHRLHTLTLGGLSGRPRSDGRCGCADSCNRRRGMAIFARWASREQGHSAICSVTSVSVCPR